MSSATDPFEMTTNDSQGGDFERPQPGIRTAALVAVVDLGTQCNKFDPGKKERKCLLAWELAGEFDSEGRPFIVGSVYTTSMHAKASLRQMLEGWLGRKFPEGQGVNPTSMLGKPCTLNLGEKALASGKTVVEVNSVGPVMRNQTPQQPFTTPYVFRMTELTSSAVDPVFPDWLPRVYGEPVADVVKASQEFGALSPF